MANSEWINVSVEDLSQDTQDLYAEFKAAYRKASEARRLFEEQMNEEFQDNLAPGTELKFGYKFGKLSVTTGPKVERKVAAKARPSLESFLDQRRGNGQEY